MHGGRLRHAVRAAPYDKQHAEGRGVEPPARHVDDCIGVYIGTRCPCVGHTLKALEQPSALHPSPGRECILGDASPAIVHRTELDLREEVVAIITTVCWTAAPALEAVAEAVAAARYGSSVGGEWVDGHVRARWDAQVGGLECAAFARREHLWAEVQLILGGPRNEIVGVTATNCRGDYVAVRWTHEHVVVRTLF